ncbi:replication initiation factor domain-containing protein [Streptococcus constellatus]|uniref:replication initiation factor domain-containing protein n=1 Tax=Streptococcus constellatus TaxID=76860 RepID=UPI00065FF9E2|nr:replication initiation factor domain-containing protein [Streptococcus constellatus]
MNPMYLKDFRKKRKLTQKKFALSAGISLQSLKFYETGRRELTLDKFREIKSKFGCLEHDPSRLRVMVDYVRITLMSIRDLEFFCKKFLHVAFKDFQSYESKLMNYNHLWKRGDIWIFDYFDKFETGNYQITMQLSGKGCRQMELIFENERITWLDFFQELKIAYGEDMRVTRLDLAIDELYQGYEKETEQFLLSDMITKYYHKELDFNSMRTWNYIGGGSLNFEDEQEIEENRQGISLYFGSRQSEMYFNFYEKRYELAKQENLSVEESLEVFGIWNRYEIRLSHGKAQGVVEEYLLGVDLAEIARALINSKINVYDGLNDYGAYLMDKKWQLLFGGVEPLKLSTQPETYNIERTIRWLMHQVSDSLALVEEYDKLVCEENLRMIINSGELNDRGEKILNAVRSSLASERRVI